MLKTNKSLKTEFCACCGASPCLCDFDIWGDPLDPEEDDDEWADDFSCDDCGPWCPDWGGDGLCMVAIEEQAKGEEEYMSRYHKPSVSCPVCQNTLPFFEIMADELWVWPGDWYSPMVAVGIFGILDTPKGVIHSDQNIHHVWVGRGQYRTEKLICLLGEPRSRER